MTFIAIVIILIILKFIYDSYLTNNTESRYQDYKSTVYGMRTDGFYVFKQKATSTWGEKLLLNHILIFNANGFVIYIEQDPNLREFPSSKGIKDLVLEFSKVTDKDDSVTIEKWGKSCVRYLKKGNKLDIVFDGNKFPDRKTWIEKNMGAKIFRGTVDHNNLYLTFENIYFDQTIGSPKSHKYFNNKKFSFLN
tara:strand:+ start:1286 stop:1864 length:579 start_codon:yes stop_codon:yes gene_type:complete